MSDISVNWTAASRSAWRHHLRLFALAVTSAVAAAIVLILFVGTAAVAAAGAAAAMATAVLAVRTMVARADDRSWSVDLTGRIAVRRADLVAEATVVFASSFLIVLRHGNRTLEVWRDATPATAFRRLAVAARWRVARGASAVDPDHAADRT